ncbi:flocculation protein FLO1-like [Teleopsis dalmanni]|uniref:flocculation protein FLO1-like n=1 Tax=Teleopsis dalmanni TaxID=139649 RepID=UPI0018CCF068|nr:flocculation protein FLO1-like [Teleopsis dalmanni]
MSVGINNLSVLLLFVSFTNIFASDYDSYCIINRSGHNLLPHQNDCTKFVQCAHGKAYVHRCPASLHWNKIRKVCDYPENAKCDLLITSAEGLKNSTALNTLSCLNGTYYQHEKYCQYYYYCREGVKVLSSCPTGLQWQQVQQKCMLSDMVKCIDSSPISQDIVHGSVYGPCSGTDGFKVSFYLNHPYDCGKFLVCANSKVFVMKCASGLMWNPNKKVCDYAEIVKCFNGSLFKNTTSSTTHTSVTTFDETTQFAVSTESWITDINGRTADLNKDSIENLNDTVITATSTSIVPISTSTILLHTIKNQEVSINKNEQDMQTFTEESSTVKTTSDSFSEPTVSMTNNNLKTDDDILEKFTYTDTNTSYTQSINSVEESHAIDCEPVVEKVLNITKTTTAINETLDLNELSAVKNSADSFATAQNFYNPESMSTSASTIDYTGTIIPIMSADILQNNNIETSTELVEISIADNSDIIQNLNTTETILTSATTIDYTGTTIPIMSADILQNNNIETSTELVEISVADNSDIIQNLNTTETILTSATTIDYTGTTIPIMSADILQNKNNKIPVELTTSVTDPEIIDNLSSSTQLTKIATISAVPTDNSTAHVSNNMSTIQMSTTVVEESSTPLENEIIATPNTTIITTTTATATLINTKPKNENNDLINLYETESKSKHALANDMRQITIPDKRSTKINENTANNLLKKSFGNSPNTATKKNSIRYSEANKKHSTTTKRTLPTKRTTTPTSILLQIIDPRLPFRAPQCIGIGNRIKFAADNCLQFYQCFEGYAYLLNCYEGFEFSVTKGRCMNSLKVVKSCLK